MPTRDIAIGIVGHVARAAEATRLFETLEAGFVSIDHGTIGCTANHLRVWQHLAQCDSAWSIVLEDDAQPCDGFTQQLGMALAAAPTPIVSLYLGTSKPSAWQPRIKRAIAKADEADACYITAPLLLHAVAVAIRTELVADMLEHMPADKPIDNAISQWARNHDISYTHGSLVDHTDGPTLVRHTYDASTQPRKAWRMGTRDTWTTTTIAM